MTAYDIKSFKIGNGRDEVSVQINKYDTSELVHYEFRGTHFNFTEPLLGLHVVTYSDSTNNYQNGIGHLTSIPDLYRKSLNTIKIVLADTSIYEFDIFDFEVNE